MFADVVIWLIFQFHKGAIETLNLLLLRGLLKSFNSIKVRLKLDLDTLDQRESATFNSIKVRLKHNSDATYCKLRSFQFHKGAIETESAFSVRTHTMLSIP